MPISGLMIAGNAIIIQTALIAASYLYYAHRGRHVAYWPLRSAALFALTALVTGLQFVFPAVLSLFRRDLDGLRAGEWWRLVTPLFVQPAGTSQVLANAFFLATFLPIAERLYRGGAIMVYFMAGILAQIDRYIWDPTGGGSSSAAFGVIGALSGYILRYRRQLPIPVLILSLVSVGGAVMLVVAHDGHGVGFLIGAVVAMVLPASAPPDSQQTDSRLVVNA